MVSYYNSLAMFPNRHAPQSSSPAAAAAAAAAAYLGYHGYHHPHHHHHHHAPHHHVHPQASPPAPPSATHHQSPHHHLHHNIGHHLPHHQYSAENHEIGGAQSGGMNHAGVQQHHQYAPPTPPSQYDHGPHHHLPHHLLQHHVHAHAESDGQTSSPQPPVASPAAWHSPVYAAPPCPRSADGMPGTVYEGWSPQPSMQPAMGPSASSAGPQGSPPSPSSATPEYKLPPSLDFSAGGSPAMMGMASHQPQDLSNGATPSVPPLPGASLTLVGTAMPPHHASPDSGLAGSSDGVSSSAGSPQHIHQLQQQHQSHPQMGHQGPGMQMPMHASQQALLQAAAGELRQHPQQSQQQSDQHQQQQQPRPQPVRSPYEWMKKPSYQSQPNPGKTRTKDKYRVVYSDRQRLELEKEFHYSRYITIRRKSELATALGLSDRQVKIWFQNRRAKERKHLKKREEVAHKEKMDPEVSNGQQPRDQTQLPMSEQMPPDLIPTPNQLHIASHPLHAQHLHHHHPHQQHHSDLNEAPSQQQPSMVLPLAIGGVDL